MRAHPAGLPGRSACSKTRSSRCLGFQHATSCSSRPHLRCSIVLRAYSPASQTGGQPRPHSEQRQQQQQEHASSTATVTSASGVLHSTQSPATSLLQALRSLCQSLAHLSGKLGSKLVQAAGWAALCLLVGLLLPARVAFGRGKAQPTLPLPLASITVSSLSKGGSPHEAQHCREPAHSSTDAGCASSCSYHAGKQHLQHASPLHASSPAAAPWLPGPLSSTQDSLPCGPQLLYTLAGAARSQPQQQAPAAQAPQSSSDRSPNTSSSTSTASTASGAPAQEASQAAASSDASAPAGAGASAGSQQGAAGTAAGGAPAAPSSPTQVAPPPPLTGDEVIAAVDSAVQNLFTSVQPLVVNVSGARASSTFSTLDITRPPAGSASGLVWDDRGHVVCPYSAVRGSAEVKVAFADAATYTAKVVGWDAAKDIAVLRLSMPKQKLKELVGVTLGSSSTAAIGQSVFVVGNATGLDHTLTRGLISGLGRELPSSGPYPQKGLIQVDAACGHQAGGALLDAKGRVLGIVCAPFVPGGRAAGYGLGYALPMDTVRGLVEQIVVAGRATRPALGITLAPPQVLAASRAEGVLVLEVHHGSPGHAAGVRPTHRDIFGDIILGDVIVGLDARPVRHAGDLYAALDMRKPGDRVRLDILRDGKATSLTLVLGERGAAGAFED